MKRAPILLLPVVAGLAACQPSVEAYTPLLDRFVLPQARELGVDLEQCRELAAKPDVSDLLLSEAAFGTALGGTFGLLAGVLFGSPSWGLGIGAAYGAVVGYSSGVAQSQRMQQDIVGRCLLGRGYSVLAP